MDWQSAFNIVYGALVVVLGWLHKMQYDRQKTFEDDFKKLPDIYARRDDVKDGFDRIEKTLTRIEEKLDNKADKH